MRELPGVRLHEHLAIPGPPSQPDFHDITNAVNELAAQGRWDERTVRVTFVPRGLIMPSDLPELREAPAAIPEARIGRVSIVTE